MKNPTVPEPFLYQDFQQALATLKGALMRAPAYNLRTMSFSQAWNELNRYTTTMRMREDNLCRACPAQTCSRCPAWGYLEHEDADAKAWFACALEKEREAYFLSTNRQRNAK